MTSGQYQSFFEKWLTLQPSLNQNPTKIFNKLKFEGKKSNLRGLIYQTYKFGENAMTNIY